MFPQGPDTRHGKDHITDISELQQEDIFNVFRYDRTAFNLHGFEPLLLKSLWDDIIFLKELT
jgi:hypothetical protein